MKCRRQRHLRPEKGKASRLLFSPASPLSLIVLPLSGEGQRHHCTARDQRRRGLRQVHALEDHAQRLPGRRPKRKEGTSNERPAAAGFGERSRGSKSGDRGPRSRAKRRPKLPSRRPKPATAPKHDARASQGRAPPRAPAAAARNAVQRAACKARLSCLLKCSRSGGDSSPRRPSRRRCRGRYFLELRLFSRK